MKSLQENINFQVMARALREHVRAKALHAGSTIVYMENGNLIEEDPKTLKKTVLKKQPATDSD